MASSPLTYHFDWDPVKAQTNVRDHKITFRLATTVFHDPLALTVYDGPHSESEERWASIGQAENGQYLVVIHTFAHTSQTDVAIRVISARKATKQEVRDYEQTPR
jgi:hypothetical protein